MFLDKRSTVKNSFKNQQRENGIQPSILFWQLSPNQSPGTGMNLFEKQHLWTKLKAAGGWWDVIIYLPFSANGKHAGAHAFSRTRLVHLFRLYRRRLFLSFQSGQGETARFLVNPKVRREPPPDKSPRAGWVRLF